MGNVMRKFICSILVAALIYLVPVNIFSSNYIGFDVIQQTESSLTLRYISAYSGTKLLTDAVNTEYSIPKFNNAQIDVIDIESFPVFSAKANILVPSENSFTTSIIKSVNHTITNFKLSPFPEYLFDKEINNNVSFDSYRTIDLPNFAAEYVGISRGQHIAQLIVNPVKYDKNQLTLTIIDTMIIRLDFDLTKVNKSFKINGFSELSAINYDMGKYWSANQIDIKKDKPSLQSPNSPKMSSLSNGQWGKIIIEEDGIYKLDPSDLQSIGIPTNKESAKTLKIFGKTGMSLSEVVSDGENNALDEQEIIVKTKSDGSIEQVIFFAPGTRGFKIRDNLFRSYKNFYSEKNYLLITWGGADGKRANPLPNSSGEIQNRPSNYTERVFVDEDIVNPYTPGAGRDWLGRSFFSTPLPPVMLHDLDRSGEIEYRFAMAHKANSNGIFSVFENNEQIGKISLGGYNANSYLSAVRNFLDVKIPSSKISSDNRSIIKFQYQNSQQTAVGFFDYYELSYPRSFFAVNNNINFFADRDLKGLTEYTVNGFSGEIYGYDLSDAKSPKLMTNKATTGGIYSFCSDFNDTTLRRFFISSNIKKPRLEIIEIKNLRDNVDNAEIVIITHPDLIGSAEKFRDYRAAQSGKKTQVYRTDHIYNEYSSGIPDPTAIRDFLIDIYKRWDVKPEYLVIWGDGHYDFRNISTNKVNYIPAYQTYAPDIKSFSDISTGYATDDYYALIDGNDLMVDLNFGRVTVDSPELGYWIVDKIKHYETSQSDDIWRTNIILVADDGPADGDAYETEHMGQTEYLQNGIISKYNPGLQYDKIYLIEFPTIYAGSGRRKPAATDEMLTRINTTGGLILNWIGHGNPRVWAHEQILDRDITIPQMRNLDKLFFLTAATCDFGRFDDPEIRSGAEDMFLSKYGGAIGVFSATRIVYSNENAQLTYAFYNRLLTPNSETGKLPTLGEAIRAVKQTFAKENDRKYFLLGDPTMKLHLPDHKVQIASINEEALPDNGDVVNLSALSKIKIKGYVTTPMGNQPDNTFNGTVVVTLRDGDIFMKIRETYLNILRPNVTFTKLGGSLNRSSYKVENGMFETEFIIPKDISFSDSLGKLFLYSASDDGRYASGSYHNIMINGFSDIDQRDTTPPEISIFFDGRNFKTGEVVTENPRLIVDLFDESGINTTGLGIGHSIEAWIDDSPISIDLTNKFTSSLTDSRRGTVEDIIFGLSAGSHKIKVRAWDVFNNFSVKEVSFVIPERNGEVIENIHSFPNPFSDGTNIVFRHNAVAPFDVNLEIFTINGLLIRNVKITLNSLHTSQIYWDGLDNSGNKVPDGIYLVNVLLRHDTGLSIGRGKLIKIDN